MTVEQLEQEIVRIIKNGEYKKIEKITKDFSKIIAKYLKILADVTYTDEKETVEILKILVRIIQEQNKKLIELEEELKNIKAMNVKQNIKFNY